MANIALHAHPFKHNCTNQQTNKFYVTQHTPHNAQAMLLETEQVLGATFYPSPDSHVSTQANVVDLGNRGHASPWSFRLSVDKPLIVLVQATHTTDGVHGAMATATALAISITEPTREAKQVTLTFDGLCLDSPCGTCDRHTNTTTIRVDLPQMEQAGSTVQLVCRTGGGVDVDRE